MAKWPLHGEVMATAVEEAREGAPGPMLGAQVPALLWAVPSLTEAEGHLPLQVPRDLLHEIPHRIYSVRGWASVIPENCRCPLTWQVDGNQRKGVRGRRLGRKRQLTPEPSAALRKH